MNRIPLVTLRRTDGGWGLLCGTCEWVGFELTRPEADLSGRDHQAACAKEGHHR